MNHDSCNEDYVMPFGKYKGKTLGYISYIDPDYILWMAKESVIHIDKEFLNCVEYDVRERDSELHDVVIEHYYDIY